MRRLQKISLSGLAALVAMPLLMSVPGYAQYQTPDKVQDHTWSPDTPNMNGTSPTLPGYSTSAQGWKPPEPVKVVEPAKPEPPKQEGAWTYAANGHVENTCTAGASVIEASRGCYLNGVAVDEGQCNPVSKPPYATCKFWSLNGGQGNCPTGYPTIGFTQTLEYASVGFMYDWKGTCYPSTITPYR